MEPSTKQSKNIEESSHEANSDGEEVNKIVKIVTTVQIKKKIYINHKIIKKI